MTTVKKRKYAKTAHAHRQARHTLDMFWNDRERAVDLERLAEAMEIVLVENDLGLEISGMAFIDEGRRYVCYNEDHHPNRQRFTIAHEIGHHILHSDILEEGAHVDGSILRRDSMSSKGTMNVEIEANAFASELLLPIWLMREKIPVHMELGDDTKLKILADDLEVSTAALNFRIARM